MAGLQQRGGRFRVLFRYHGKQFSLDSARCPSNQARPRSEPMDYLLLRLNKSSSPPAGSIASSCLDAPRWPPLERVGGRTTLLSRFLRPRALGTWSTATSRLSEGAEANTLGDREIHLIHLIAMLARRSCCVNIGGRRAPRRPSSRR